MIALLTLLSIGSAEAAEDPKVSVSMDTGMKPLGLPIGTLLGGGMRVGVILGPVTPFAGGSASFGHGTDQLQDNDFVSGAGARLFTGQAGARLRIAQLEAAETYLLAGALLTEHTGYLTFKDGDDKQIANLGFRGLGGFGGGGVDAHMSNRVSIGVEAGVAYTGANIFTHEEQGNETYDENIGGSLVFSYTNLHLTWWLGGES